MLRALYKMTFAGNHLPQIKSRRLLELSKLVREDFEKLSANLYIEVIYVAFISKTTHTRNVDISNVSWLPVLVYTRFSKI